jgi:hypothetical protein
LLGDLAEYALEIGARLLSVDLASHVDEALRLLGIVGRRFWFARHEIMITR